MTGLRGGCVQFNKKNTQPHAGLIRGEPTFIIVKKASPLAAIGWVDLCLYK